MFASHRQQPARITSYDSEKPEKTALKREAPSFRTPTTDSTISAFELSNSESEESSHFPDSSPIIGRDSGSRWSFSAQLHVGSKHLCYLAHRLHGTDTKRPIKTNKKMGGGGGGGRRRGGGKRERGEEQLRFTGKANIKAVIPLPNI